VKASRFTIVVIFILMLSIAGCNLPSSQPVTPNAYTAAAMTVTALAGTEAAGTPQPTATLFATFPPLTITASTNTSAPPPAQASATPSGTVFVTDVGANCRTGPGTNYDKIASFAQGTYIPLVGRNAESTWWVVRTGATTCWISGTTGRTSGPLENIPVVAAPPSPTPGRTATASPTSYP
jgi:uncharacterized protein YgiM (DUF1202 family)